VTVPRFNRDYEFQVQVPGGTVTVRPPLRIEFQADKSIRGQLNKIQVKLYNLDERKRLALVKDAEQQKRIPFRLSVGYEGALEMVFSGTIHTGSNSRQGPDHITTIEGLDGGFDFLNSFTSRTVLGGDEAVKAVLQDMPDTAEGKITERPTTSRPKVLVGNSVQIIEDGLDPNETWYIDDGQLYIIKPDEVTSRFIPVVSAATGLLNTPTREASVVTFDTLMNPAVKIGQRVQLESVTAPHLNGIYRLDTISYSGDNYGDDWRMTCSGFLRSQARVL